MALFDIFKRKNTKNNLAKFDYISQSNAIVGKDSTTFFCMDLIASTFASLSGHFYSTGEKEQLNNYHLEKLVKNPNADDTRYQFFYNCVIDYYNGNVYLFKAKDEGGNTVSLFRLNPAAVRVKRNDFNQKVFSYKSTEYTSDDIIHIPSRFGYDGLTGKSIFNQCSTILNTINDIEVYTKNSFENSIGKRLVIDAEKAFPNATQEQINQLKGLFLNHYTGIKNSGVPLIKSNKLDYSTIDTGASDNRSQQLAENRELTIKEISKIFGIPYDMLIGSVTNLEETYTLFIDNAIRPLVNIFEESINKFLIPMEDRDVAFFEYNYGSLYRTSVSAKIEAYTKQITNGILTVNEVRRKENLSVIDNEAGNTLYIPANLIPLKDNVVNAFLASAQLKLEDLKEKENQHSIVGDDKGA